MKVYRIYGSGYQWHNTYTSVEEFDAAIAEINADLFERVESTQLLEKITLPGVRDQRIREEDFDDPALDMFQVREIVKDLIVGVKQESEKAVFVLPEYKEVALECLKKAGIEARI